MDILYFLHIKKKGEHVHSSLCAADYFKICRNKKSRTYIFVMQVYSGSVVSGNTLKYQ